MRCQTSPSSYRIATRTYLHIAVAIFHSLFRPLHCFPPDCTACPGLGRHAIRPAPSSSDSRTAAPNRLALRLPFDPPCCIHTAVWSLTAASTLPFALLLPPQCRWPPVASHYRPPLSCLYSAVRSSSASKLPSAPELPPYCHPIPSEPLPLSALSTRPPVYASTIRSASKFFLYLRVCAALTTFSSHPTTSLRSRAQHIPMRPLLTLNKYIKNFENLNIQSNVSKINEKVTFIIQCLLIWIKR